MSTHGVRTRFIDLLVRGRGRVSEAAFTELIAYARERGITSGEAKALLQPAEYLRISRVLRTHGIRLGLPEESAPSLSRECATAPRSSRAQNAA